MHDDLGMPKPASRVTIVVPGAPPEDVFDCEVEVDEDLYVAHLSRGGRRLTTVPLDLCIIHWIDDASAGVTAKVLPHKRQDPDAKRFG